MYIDFGKWTGTEMTPAYTFRYMEAPAVTQQADHIENAPNPQHREGYDNISLLLPTESRAGAKAKLRCSFEGLGCPEIILVEEPELCDDGVTRYGSCFEVVLYKNGVNVWRHYMDGDHHCSWHKRVGVEFPVSENEIHELTLETKENYLVFAVDGRKTTLRTEDLFGTFRIGVTMCEGIARLYDFSVEE